MQPGVQHWHTDGLSRGAVFNDDHLRYIVLLARTSKRRLTLPGAWLTRRRAMACQMPVGTGLKMGWGCYTGDRGILARYTIRVINCCHTGGETRQIFCPQSQMQTRGDMKHNLSLANVSAAARLCLISGLLDFCPGPTGSRHF